MAFLVPARPAEPFGAWLKAQVGQDTAAGEIARAYGDDIAAGATPSEVAGILRASLGEDIGGYLGVVREWMAASLVLNALLMSEDNLIAWPRVTITDTGAGGVTCILCGEPGPALAKPALMAALEGIDGEPWGVACRDCSTAWPDGLAAWTVADVNMARRQG